MKRLFLFAALIFPLVVSGCAEEKFVNSTVTSNAVTQNPSANAAKSAGNTEGADFVKAVEPPSKPGKYGGTLTDSSLGDPKTFNLWVSAEASSSDAVGQLYDALLARNPYTQEWEGHLAELPKISADNLTWTFTLKPDLKWSDGQPITADDIIFTLDAVYDEKVQTNMREGMLLDAPDGKGGFKRVPLVYKKIDARIVEFKFPAPYAPAREILSFPIAPKHKLYSSWKSGQPTKTQFNSTWGVNVDVKELVSSGPWLLDSYVPGQRLVYKRNPNYWKKGVDGKALPYLDRYVTLIVPDKNTLTLKFRAGDTDITEIQHTDYPSFKSGEKQGNYTTYDLGPSSTTNFISFNQNPRSVVAKKQPWLIKAFRDTRFRQALAFAMNRQRIIDQVFVGLAQPLYGPQSPWNKQFYTDKIAQYPYDPAKAKTLLQEMGLKDSNGNGILELDGHDLKFNILTNVENNQRKIMVAIVADDFRKIGLGATFTTINANTMFGKMDTKPQQGQPYPPFDWQAAMFGFTGGGVDPINGRNIWSSTGNLHTWYPYQEKPDTKWEKEIDDIFREGAQEMDETKRKAMYDRWQQIVAEQQPLIYTVTPNSLAALRNKFGNIKPSNAAGVLWNIEDVYALDATRDTP